jgi:hypothetical protein
VVSDSQSGDLIVKLVNLLPVNVHTRVKLEEARSLQPQAVRSVLTGKPDDRKLQPLTDIINVSADFLCKLPAYSFTVLRIKQL